MDFTSGNPDQKSVEGGCGAVSAPRRLRSHCMVGRRGRQPSSVPKVCLRARDAVQSVLTACTMRGSRKAVVVAFDVSELCDIVLLMKGPEVKCTQLEATRTRR